MKPVRSILYTPGHKVQMLAKASSFGADALCLVLEDSVPVAAKKEARLLVKDHIGQLHKDGQCVLVKVNPLHSGELELDLAHIVQPGLSAVIVPKMSASKDVRTVARLLDSAEAANGVSLGATELIVLIETALAIATARELAEASGRIWGLAIGHGPNADMARALGFTWTPEGLERLYIRSKLLVDARAANCYPIDGAYFELRNSEGLAAEAEFARQLGYRGKLAVHPDQVPIINRIFTPTQREIEYFERIIREFDKEEAHGSAAFVLDGNFVDLAMVESARAAIALAQNVGVRN